MFLHLGTVQMCQAHSNFLWGVLKFARLLVHINKFTAKPFNASTSSQFQLDRSV